MKRFRLPALLLLALLQALLPACPAGAQSADAPDLDEYRQAVDQALARVREQQPGQAADLLAGIVAVALPSGEIVAVDPGYLVRLLRADQVDLAAADGRLSALRYELDNWPAGPVAPDAFDRLARVLARPEFRQNEPRPLSLPDWPFELLDALSAPLLVLAVAILAGIVAYFGFGLWGSFVRRSAVPDDETDLGPLTAGQALARSRELAAAGDYRTAIRLLYLSTLLLLEERNLLRYDRTLTNREYLRQAAQEDRRPLVQALRPVVDTFDEVWYGEVEPDAGRYEDYVHQVDELREVAE